MATIEDQIYQVISRLVYISPATEVSMREKVEKLYRAGKISYLSKTKLLSLISEKCYRGPNQIDDGRDSDAEDFNLLNQLLVVEAIIESSIDQPSETTQFSGGGTFGGGGACSSWSDDSSSSSSSSSSDSSSSSSSDSW